MPTSSSSGSRELDRQTRLLLLVNGLMITANALSGTFVGIYIWKASRNFALLGWYTLLTHVFMALTFWIGGRWVKAGGKMPSLRLGIGISALFYAVVLLLGKSGSQYVWLLGIIQGLAVGFFWLAFNVVYFEATHAGNRDRFNGFSGVIGSVANMAAPWCSGYLISRMADVQGYRVIFGMSLGIFVAGVVVSFFLRRRDAEGRYDWLLPARIWRVSHTPWRPVFIALAAQGMRESVFGVLIGLLVYLQTGSEMQLGNFALITSAVGFVSFYAAGKWLRLTWRSEAMLIGTILITVAIVPFFFGMRYVFLLIFGISASLFMPLYTIPMTSAVFDLIGVDEASARKRVEYVVLRELGLNAGRILGMTIFIATVSFSRAPLVISTMMLVTGAAPILSWVFMRNRLAPQYGHT